MFAWTRACAGIAACSGAGAGTGGLQNSTHTSPNTCAAALLLRAECAREEGAEPELLGRAPFWCAAPKRSVTEYGLVPKPGRAFDINDRGSLAPAAVLLRSILLETCDWETCSRPLSPDSELFVLDS